MEGGGEIECRRGDGTNWAGKHLGEALAGEANGRNGVSGLAADEEDAGLRESVEEDDTAGMLLDDLQAVAAAGTTAQLGGGGERGVCEHPNGRVGRLAGTCAVEQMTGVIADGGLLDPREGGQGGKFRVQARSGGQGLGGGFDLRRRRAIFPRRGGAEAELV